MTTNASSSATKVKDWLDSSTKQLKSAGIGTARLDCLVLLEDEINRDRSFLLAHPELELTAKQLNKLSVRLERRMNHEPLAFIRGKTEFYGREFMISADVLEPRPESETMVELLKKLSLSDKPRIFDVGSGSGAIGITAQLELPNSQVSMYEVDPKAIRVSRSNTKKYNLRIKTVKSDLLNNAMDSPDVILANLPYVPDNYQINQAALMEPRLAIFGGVDGLDLYHKLFQQIAGKQWQPIILTESLPFQHGELEIVASQHGYRQHLEDDFIQVFVPS